MPDHPAAPPARLLLLINPGQLSRYYMLGLARAARQLGLAVVEWELEPIWRQLTADPRGTSQRLADQARREQVGAVLGYIFNPMIGPPVKAADGRLQGLFEALGIPCLMFWTDHPQRIANRAGLKPVLRDLLASANHHHLLKSQPAADELHAMAGWQSCHAVPVAEDAPADLPPPKPRDFDIVAISGWLKPLPEGLAPLLAHDRPDPAQILGVVADQVRGQLKDLWASAAPPAIQPHLGGLGEEWVEALRADPKRAPFRHWAGLETAHPEAAGFLRSHPALYFDAGEILWEFGNWERAFVLQYLARYFRVGLFGTASPTDDRPVGAWVPYEQQAAVYRRGRLALNISGGWEAEGITHKPFQIAASGVPMLHDFQYGMAECFAPGREVLMFRSPAEARELAHDLLGHPQRAAALGAAAHHRVVTEHGWIHRLPRMLASAGLSLEPFRNPA